LQIPPDPEWNGMEEANLPAWRPLDVHTCTPYFETFTPFNEILLLMNHIWNNNEI
jgi:hypothetical protein